MPSSDGVELAPSSLRDLRSLADAYKDGDKVLQKRIRTGIQQAAKPLADAVIREGSETLPARGGLRARIAASRGAVTASLGGRTAAVSIRATNAQKDALRALDEGALRHPVYGRWVRGMAPQRVPARQFSNAFDRNAPKVRDQVNAEIAKALDEIAREASH